MAETSTQTDAVSSTGLRGNLESTAQLLRVVYGLFPIVAGIDKFTNVLATWPDYVPTMIANLLPVAPQTFMYVVGVVEIVAGLVVFWRTEYGAYLVAGWLTVVAVTQILAGNLDIAVRDIWIAVGAVALAQLTAHIRS